MAAWQTDACFCTRIDLPSRWLVLSGRPQLGVIATQVADLTLRIATVLHDLSLPAGLARDVLLASTADFVDEVRPTDADDWLTMVRVAQDWPRARIEDYVAVLSAGGVLVPVDGNGQGAR
jgi:hypothetical protein